MQNELKESNDKYGVSMETIQVITHERDAATNQLGIAYLTTERLKAQIKALVDENEYLKAQVSIAQGGNFSRKDGMSDSGPTASAAAPTRTVETDGQDYTELLDFDIGRVENRPVSRLSGHPNQQTARLHIDLVERPAGNVQRRGATQPPAPERNYVRDARNAASRPDATDRNSTGQFLARQQSQATPSDREISYGPKTRIVLEEYPPNKAVKSSSKQDVAVQANVLEEHRAMKPGPVFADELPGDFTVLSSDPSVSDSSDALVVLIYHRLDCSLRSARSWNSPGGKGNSAWRKSAGEQRKRLRLLRKMLAARSNVVPPLMRRSSAQANSASVIASLEIRWPAQQKATWYDSFPLY